LTSNDKIYEFYDQKSVKICGITFSNDKELAYKENIIQKIFKLERQLDIWRSRQLTLEGKILIVKTFGLSQLIYSLQSVIIKKVDKLKIEDLIFRFIWNIKKSNKISSGKINRPTLKSSIDQGGLNAPDIEIIDKAIKYKNFLRHTQSRITHPVGIIYRNILKKVNFTLANYHCNRLISGFLGSAIDQKLSCICPKHRSF